MPRYESSADIRDHMLRLKKKLMKPKPLPKMRDIFAIPPGYKVPKDSKYSF